MQCAAGALAWILGNACRAAFGSAVRTGRGRAEAQAGAAPAQVGGSRLRLLGMPEREPVPASCLCGGVRLELDPPFELASYCHCEHCRKHSGNFGSASLAVPVGQLRIVAGEELLGRWQPAPGLAVKVFCTRCGSSLFGTREPEGPNVWVRMGALDADPGLRPTRHVFAGSAPAWFPIPEDGLRRIDGRPPD